MLKLFYVLLIVSVLLGSAVATQDVYAKSYKSQITKSIIDDAESYKKVCEVWQETVDNKDLHKVYEKANSIKCGTTLPPVPVNQPPVLKVDSPIKCLIDQDCTATINEVKDNDGNITAILWNQESGPSVNFTVGEGSLSATFHPVINGTYVFSVAAQDNNGSTTAKSIKANVGVNEPLECPEGTHEEDGKCVDDVTPTPNATSLKLGFAGDFDCSNTAVFNQIKSEHFDVFVALGDLCYKSTLSDFKSVYGTLGNTLQCVIGNHDAEEDGSSSIYQEALAYCGDSYTIKKIGGTIVVGLNTNGDTKKQGEQIAALLSTSFIDGVKNVIFTSHKGCVTPPNSHHPADEDAKAKAVVEMCKVLDAAIPNNVTATFISGHNHVMSKSADGKYYQSGAGGKGHYTCGTDNYFTFCDNKHYGYLKVEVDEHGKLTSQFIDANGGIVK